MKNLIKLLALATISLAACNKKETAPAQLVYVYGRIIDSSNTAEANKPYEVILGDNPIKSPNAVSYTTLSTFATDSAGNFNFTIYKPEHDRKATIWYNQSYLSYPFTITPSVGDSLNIGSITLADVRY